MFYIILGEWTNRKTNLRATTQKILTIGIYKQKRKLSWEKGKIENAIFIEEMFFNQIFTKWSRPCGQFTWQIFH